jgi:hypothetical protein
MRAMAKRRAMLDMAMRMMEIAYDPEHDPAEFVGIAQLASDAVLNDRLDTHGETPDEFLDPYTAYLEKLEESGGGGVPTPFWKFNGLIRSFMPGDLADDLDDFLEADFIDGPLGEHRDEIVLHQHGQRLEPPQRLALGLFGVDEELRQLVDVSPLARGEVGQGGLDELV